jgi:competence protein ComGC
MSRLGIFKELWAFVRQRKRYWLVPVIVVLVLLGVLLVLAENSAIAPFIYSLF